MATYKDEYYEVRKGGFLGKFVALLLGFLLGIISTIGGIAGLGYYIVAKLKIRKAADYLNSFGLTFNVENFVGEDYVDGTVLNLVKDLTKLGAEYQSGTLTLTSLEPFSPYVRTLAENLTKTMNKYGVDTTTEELMTLSLSADGVMTYAKDKADGIELGAVLEAVGVEKSPLILSLCYGEEGVDYEVAENGDIKMLGGAKATTVGDILSQEFDALLDRVSVASIMSLAGDVNTQDSISRALLYGQEDETYSYDEATGKIEMLPLTYKVTEATITDPDGKVYTYNEETERYETDKPENGYIKVAESTAPAAMSTAVLSEAYSVYDKEGALVYTLKQSENYGVFHAYKSNVLQKHRPLSLSTLMAGDFESLISNFYLCDLLSVTAKSDGVVLSLCYGSEGEDYIIVGTGDDAKIEVLNQDAKRSVADLMGDNSAELFDSLELGAILGVSPTDDTMCALAYGKKGTQYTVTDNTDGSKKIEMLPIEYTLKEDGLYDDDNAKIAAENYTLDTDSGVYTITLKDGDETKTVYAAKTTAVEKPDGETAYCLYEKADLSKESQMYHKKKTVADLRGGSDEMFNDLELGVLIGANSKSDSVVLALCYGTEGEDYQIKADGEIEMIGGAKPTTVADLMGDNATEIFNSLELGVLIGANAKSDKVILSLCYGTEGEDYNIVGTGDDAKIKMIGDAKPTTVADLMGENSAELFDSLELGAILSVDPTDDTMCAIAYGKKGTQYKVTDNDDGSKKIEMLSIKYTFKDDVWYNEDGEQIATPTKQENGRYEITRGETTVYAEETNEEGIYEIYETATSTDAILYSKKTVGNLRGGSDEMFNDLELGVLIGADGKSDKVILSLCYGTEGEDYQIEADGEIVMIGGSKPTTVSDLMGDNATEIFNSLEIGAILNVDPTDDTMCAIAYGRKGIQYEVYEEGDGEDKTLTIRMLPVVYTLKEDGLYDDDNAKIAAENYTLDADSGVYTITLKDGDKTKTVYAKATDQDETKYYLYEKADLSKESQMYHKKKTLADLRGGSDELMNDLEIAVLLDVKYDSDPLKIALAYGTEGEDFVFEYDEETGEKIGIRPLNPPKTVSSLQADGTFDDIRLDSVMEVDLSNKVTMYVLYGAEGMHYELDKSNNVRMLGMRIAVYVDEETGEVTAWDEQGEKLGPENFYYSDSDGKYYHEYLHDKFVIDVTEGGKYRDSEDNKTFYAWEQTNEAGEVVETIQVPYYVGYYVNEQGVAMDTPYIYPARTIGDLSGEHCPIGTVTEELRIGEIFGGETSSPLMTAIANWKIADLDNQENIESLKLADVLGDSGSSKILQTIIDKDWKIADLKDQENIEGLKLADIIEINDSSSGILKAIKENKWSIKDLQDQENIEGLKLADIITIDENSSGILKAIKENKWSIKDLQDQENIEGLKLADIIPIDDSSSGILKAIKTKGWTLSNLKNQSDIESLTIRELVGETDVQILSAISGYSIAELKQDGFLEKELTIGELVGDTDVPMLKALSGYSIAYLKTEGKLETELKIGDLVSDTSSPLMQAIGGWTISQLSNKDYLEKNLKIGDLIEIDEDTHQVLKTLSVYTIEKLMDPKTINGLKLNEVIAIDNTSPAILQALGQSTLTELQDKATFDKLSLGDVITIDEENENNTPKFLRTLIGKGYTIGQLNSPDTMNNLTLGDVVEITDEDAHFLRSLANVPLSELTQEINEMKLSEVLETNSQNDRILKHLQASTLKTLTDDLAALTVQVVYEDLVYRSISAGGSYLTYASYADYDAGVKTKMTVTAEEKYVIVNEDSIRIVLDERDTTENATKQTHQKYYIENSDDPTTEAFDPEYSEPVLVGTWKYLLRYETKNGDGTYTYEEKDVPVENMDQMINNIQANVKRAPLYEFNKDMELGLDQGFLDSDLNETIIEYGSAYYTTKEPNADKFALFKDMQVIYERETDGAKIGDISIEQLAAYIFVLMKVATYPTIGL